MEGEGKNPLYAECPGEPNILLTPDTPEKEEIRWFNASKFTCYWRIQAPADHYIGVNLTNMEGFKCEQSCYSFVEIKYGNMANSGPRFCCDLPKETLYTEVVGHEVIIITHGYKPGNYSVNLSYSITK
uniref:CUB domain-containing protein n=1 Tax=Meloidogyne incognita TaxID=6306 RepID=A0A914KR45_MELIC